MDPLTFLILELMLLTIKPVGKLVIKAVMWLYVKLISFAKHILPYFLNKKGSLTGSHLKAISLLIQKDLLTGKYATISGVLEPHVNGAIVSGIFDTNKGSFTNEEMDIKRYSDLDTDTKYAFREHNLLVVS